MALEFVRPGWNAPVNVRAVTTTRAGGASVGRYASLNLGNHVGDDPLRVEANRRRVAESLGLPCEPLWLQQVHGTVVVNAATAASAAVPATAPGVALPPASMQSPDAALPLLSPGSCVATADGAFATRPGAVCAVLTADCVPVFLCRADGGAVALLHAGWRGLAAGIVEAGARALGDAASLIAWAGPGIGPGAFEVGAEVRTALAAGDGAEACFRPAGPAGRWYADLYELVGLRLRRTGVERYGYDAGACTFTQSERFFSHRRDRVTGRMASLIWLER